MTVLRLDGDEARRMAVRAQRLDANRPTELLGLVRHLTFLQLDPTAAIAPSADLIAWSRLGPSYRPDHLQQAQQDRALFEHKAQDDPTSPQIAMVRPTSDLGLHLAAMAASPPSGPTRDWLRINDPFRLDILDRLRDTGPLLSRDIPDTSIAAWPSTGWTNNRNVTKMLELLVARGEVATSGRVGRQRTWDLAERVYLADVEVVPEPEARRRRDMRRLQALGIARSVLVGEAGVPAQVDGSSLTWRVDPCAVGKAFTGRTALLSPFDRLIHDRVRAQDIFGFEYILEMYKLDAIADLKRGTLVVNDIHEDEPFTSEVAAAVTAEIEALASWLNLTAVRQ